jgi:hypothetical protein
VTVLDHRGEPIETHGPHEAETAALKIALNGLCAGKKAGVIAVSCIETVIHLAQQANGSRAFREEVARMFAEAARIMRRHL